MPIVIETQAEFEARHSQGKPPAKLSNGRWLFADGAMLHHGEGIRGNDTTLQEPPADEFEQIKAMIRYQKIRQGIARAHFEKLKAASLGAVQEGGGLALQYTWSEREFGPAPPDLRDGVPCNVAALKRLKAIHDEHAAEADRLQAILDARPEAIAQRQREEEARKSEAEAASRNATRVREIEEITL